jgi:2,4-dienoyl-CoA reductase (NADPH2)
VLADGYADVVALSRPIFCDADLPRKAFAGEFDDIRICIRCSHCLWSFVQDLQVECAYNPELGREREFAIVRTEKPKKVLVIGGGPGGLEAARVAALRGHDVTLWEKEKRLGGQVNLASLPPGKADYRIHVVGWLSRQCEKAGVKVKTETKGTVKGVEKFNADVAVVAVGATPGAMPDIPGVKKKHVYNSYEVLVGKAKVEGKRVVVSRGWRDGAEMAEILAKRGHEVTLVEHENQIAWDMNFWSFMYLFQQLMGLRVNMMTNSRIVRILDDGVLVLDGNLQEHKVAADAVVLAWGRAPNRGLAGSLKGKVPKLYTIGDCVRPREIVDAVKEGAYVARDF